MRYFWLRDRKRVLIYPDNTRRSHVVIVLLLCGQDHQVGVCMRTFIRSSMADKENQGPSPSPAEPPKKTKTSILQ